MEKHKKFSGSKISRIIRCPGSEDFVQYLIQKRDIPAEESSGAAEEGTLLHDRQEKAIQGLPFEDGLDAEQIDCIDLCSSWLVSLQEKYDLTWLQTERKVTLDGYGIEEAGGTADVVAGSTTKSLHIIDWKFGKGVPVSVVKNEQLMTYLLGVAEEIEKLKAFDELWIHIGQPRFGYFESYQCSINELMGLINAIKNATKSHDIVAGEKQCLWCRGKTRCAEYEISVREKATSIFTVHDQMKNNYSDFKLMAEVLKLEPFFKKVFKAIKDTYTEMSPGQLSEFKLKRVAGRSTRTYVSEEQVVEYLCKNYSDIDDVYTEPKLKSPSQIEKAIKGIKKDPEFQKLIIKPLGKPTIVSIDDARPDYSEGAVSVFSHLAKE